MKKTIGGLAVLGAFIGARQLLKHKAPALRERCEQMAANCKQMMALAGARDEEGAMTEHREQVGDRRQTVAA